MFTPTQTNASPTSFQMPTAGGGGGVSRRMVAIIGAVLLVVVLGVGVVLWLRSRTTDSPGAPRTSNASVNTQSDTRSVTPTSVMQVVYPADADGDGLSDDEEQRLGTNPQKSDTDGDGFSDAEEVIGRKTNPLVKDGPAEHPSARGYQP